MKHKNNDLVPQIFIAVVAVILIGITVYYIINSFRSATKVGDVVIENTEKTALEYIEHDIMMYNGEEIRGSEVVNVIKKQLGDYDTTETAPIYIEVVTKASAVTNINTYTNKEHIDKIKNFSNLQYYIKPTALFDGEVIRTGNKVIIGIKFTQK